MATPIGNLEDMTARALKTLQEVSLIAAEDTRRTGLLLQHLSLRKPMVSYHKFNESGRVTELLDTLGRGENVALVSDAGTPAISDPGERIVRAAVQAGFRVEPIPGPSAAIAALSASGLPTREFHFVGFLPVKSGARRKKISSLAGMDATLIFYESPYRLVRLIQDVRECLGEREVVVARELTKKFEEFLRGTPGELLERLQNRSIKGECTVLVGPSENRSGESESEAEQGEGTETTD